MDTERFVTKEYLTKELLRYVLSLPLLPGVDELQERKQG